jgi:hypothetical protein
MILGVAATAAAADSAAGEWASKKKTKKLKNSTLHREVCCPDCCILWVRKHFISLFGKLFLAFCFAQNPNCFSKSLSRDEQPLWKLNRLKSAQAGFPSLPMHPILFCIKLVENPHKSDRSNFQRHPNAPLSSCSIPFPAESPIHVITQLLVRAACFAFTFFLKLFLHLSEPPSKSRVERMQCKLEMHALKARLPDNQKDKKCVTPAGVNGGGM